MQGAEECTFHGELDGEPLNVHRDIQRAVGGTDRYDCKQQGQGVDRYSRKYDCGDVQRCGSDDGAGAAPGYDGTDKGLGHQEALLLGIPHERASRLLRQLASQGWLARVRQGLYITVPLEARSSGDWIEDPWVVGSKAFTPCYIGGWSACEHWGLTEQIFNEIALVTARSIRERRQTLQGTIFRVKEVAPNQMFGTRAVWRRQSRVQVSDPSRTLVDMLDDPSFGGGIRHVADANRGISAWALD